MSGLLVGAMLLLVGARPPVYGGQIINYVYNDHINPDPADTRSAADAAAHAAVYERLYDLSPEGLIPVLARQEPTIDGTKIIVPLKRNIVRHDGTPLTPRLVVEALLRIDGDHPGAYVLAGVHRVEGRPQIVADEEEFAVRFELRHPNIDFAYLLAADHARLAWPQPDGSIIGTGPFAWTTPTEQAPFVRHRDGRPYAGRLTWRPYASRFGAGALAERGRAPVFGGPQAPRPLPGPGTWLVLQVGPGAGNRRQRHRIRAHVQAALQRPRIVRRYLGPEDRPATGFIAEAAAEAATKVDGGKPLDLLAVRGNRFGHRLVERVQLDLFRSGLRVQIRWLDPVTFERRSRGDFALRLIEVRPGVIDDGSARAALHRVLSAAARLGHLASVPPQLLARFAAAEEPQRRPLLAEIEQQMRRTSGAVVIGRVVPALALPSNWPPMVRGAIDWANLVPGAEP